MSGYFDNEYNDDYDYPDIDDSSINYEEDDDIGDEDDEVVLDEEDEVELDEEDNEVGEEDDEYEEEDHGFGEENGVLCEDEFGYEEEEVDSEDKEGENRVLCEDGFGYEEEEVDSEDKEEGDGVLCEDGFGYEEEEVDSEDKEEEDGVLCEDEFGYEAEAEVEEEVEEEEEDEDEEDEDYEPLFHFHGRPSSLKRMKRKQERKTEGKSRKRKGKSSNQSSGRPSKTRKVESPSKVRRQKSQQNSRQNKGLSGQDKKSSKKYRKEKPHVKISAGAIRKFSADYVKIPKEKMKWARKMATKYTKMIRTHFQSEDPKHIFSHFEFTGSFYEHLKTQDADELDILVVLDTKNKAHLEEEVKGVPGYVRIRAASNSKYRPDFVDKRGYVDPMKIRNWFFGHVQKMINQYDKQKEGKDPELKVEDNGPARTLVVHDKEKDCKLKMDLVPAFLFKPKKADSSPKSPAVKGRRYVPKPLPEDDELKTKHRHQNDLLWRRSFSFEEKTIMEKMDKKDQCCRREVIKVIKTLRERDKPLRKLKSYHIKTAFLHYNFGQGHEDLKWSRKHLSERFLGLLDYLRKKISEKKLSHFFVSDLNLLKEPEFSHSALDNIENRLSNLLSNEKELKKALMQPDNKKRKR